MFQQRFYIRKAKYIFKYLFFPQQFGLIYRWVIKWIDITGLGLSNCVISYS